MHTYHKQGLSVTGKGLAFKKKHFFIKNPHIVIKNLRLRDTKRHSIIALSPLYLFK